MDQSAAVVQKSFNSNGFFFLESICPKAVTINLPKIDALLEEIFLIVVSIHYRYINHFKSPIKNLGPVHSFPSLSFRKRNQIPTLFTLS